jgi:hypothetical protein
MRTPMPIVEQIEVCAVTSAHCKPTAIVQCENPMRTIASAGYVPLPSNSGGAGCRARGGCGTSAMRVLMNSDTLAFYRSQIFSPETKFRWRSF